VPRHTSAVSDNPIEVRARISSRRLDNVRHTGVIIAPVGFDVEQALASKEVAGLGDFVAGLNPSPDLVLLNGDRIAAQALGEYAESGSQQGSVHIERGRILDPGFELLLNWTAMRAVASFVAVSQYDGNPVCPVVVTTCWMTNGAKAIRAVLRPPLMDMLRPFMEAGVERLPFMLYGDLSASDVASSYERTKSPNFADGRVFGALGDALKDVARRYSKHLRAQVNQAVAPEHSKEQDGTAPGQGDLAAATLPTDSGVPTQSELEKEEVG